MKRKLLFLYLLPGLFLVACEEEVVLDLGDIQKKLVVEAVVSNSGPLAKISLSYSQGFYDTLSFAPFTDASVEIRSGSGKSETLETAADGNFYSKTLTPEFGEYYTLKISAGDEDFEATTQLPVPVSIKKIQFIPTPFEQNGDSLNAIIFADDPKGEDNFFRLNIYKNGKKRPGLHYFVSDELGRDEEIQMPVYFINFFFGDTVVVELMHTTREVADYYSGLSGNIGGSFNSIAPGNPVNNLPEDVMGIFAAYAIDRDTIIVSPFMAF
ncbi:MAG TPA: DUF4249 domain-containing protein [Prolixibacteraceae bacterium]|nr:DUF4249 domain-containing protein [Prolixibacteraceae bacterium]